MRHSRALFGEPDSLDRDDAANQWVFGAVNDTHAAAAQFAEDFIPAGFSGCHHLVLTDGCKTLASTFSPISAEVNPPSELVFRSRHGRSCSSVSLVLRDQLLLSRVAGHLPSAPFHLSE